MLVSMLSCRMSCISTGGMTSPPPADLPGNRLDMDLTGVINPVLAENFIAGAGYSGSWTFGGGIQPVTFETIETLTPTSTLTRDQDPRRDRGRPRRPGDLHDYGEQHWTEHGDRHHTPRIRCRRLC